MWEDLPHYGNRIWHVSSLPVELYGCGQVTYSWLIPGAFGQDHDCAESARRFMGCLLHSAEGGEGVACVSSLANCQGIVRRCRQHVRTCLPASYRTRRPKDMQMLSFSLSRQSQTIGKRQSCSTSKSCIESYWWVHVPGAFDSSMSTSSPTSPQSHHS